MGEGEAGSRENSSIWGCNHSSTTNSSWNSKYPELILNGLSIARRRSKNTIIGIDPAPRSKSGYTLLNLVEGSIKSCSTREGRITDILHGIPPGLIGIDAPLHPPYKGFRIVERIVLSEYKGARLLPGGMRGMRELAKLGASIFHYLAQAGYIVFETHPGSIYRGLVLEGFNEDHILDSTLAASAVACSLAGESFFAIAPDGLMVLPTVSCKPLVLKILNRCL